MGGAGEQTLQKDRHVLSLSHYLAYLSHSDDANVCDIGRALNTCELSERGVGVCHDASLRNNGVLGRPYLFLISPDRLQTVRDGEGGGSHFYKCSAK